MMDTLTFLEMAAIAAMQAMCTGKEPLGANRGEGQIELMAEEAFRIAEAMAAAKDRHFTARSKAGSEQVSQAHR